MVGPAGLEPALDGLSTSLFAPKWRVPQARIAVKSDIDSHQLHVAFRSRVAHKQKLAPMGLVDLLEAVTKEHPLIV